MPRKMLAPMYFLIWILYAPLIKSWYFLYQGMIPVSRNDSPFSILLVVFIEFALTKRRRHCSSHNCIFIGIYCRNKVSTNEYFWDFNKIIKNASSQYLKNRNAIRVLMSEFVNHTFSFLQSQHVQPYVSLLNLQRVAHLRHSRVANPLDKGSFFPPLN